jgi:hypothetical protein
MWDLRWHKRLAHSKLLGTRAGWEMRRHLGEKGNIFYHKEGADGLDAFSFDPTDPWADVEATEIATSGDTAGPPLDGTRAVVKFAGEETIKTKTVTMEGDTAALALQALDAEQVRCLAVALIPGLLLTPF